MPEADTNLDVLSAILDGLSDCSDPLVALWAAALAERGETADDDSTK